MLCPESWLRQFCNPPINTEQLAERLTMAGLEVEDVQRAAPAFSGVVIGRILEVQPHPGADRLRVCRVDAGQGGPLQIVCGAPNARAGIAVPCALDGAQLPPPKGQDAPLSIRRTTMRGVESQGMLCSAQELGLPGGHAGLLELGGDPPAGADLRQWLDLDEAVLEIKLTPNLGHCLSMTGVARELSAITEAPLQLPAPPAVAVTLTERLPVRIEAPDLCGRFSGRVIRGVNARAATPDWMRQRLERAGQRSISALVDISNYVMLELGRPTHVFDLDRIRGGLTVRWAQPGERLELLNGQRIDLSADMGVIAADSGVESLAGIMGGEATAVNDDTRNVYVEAAFWWPAAIRGRARRLGFSTDAAARFERGVDYSTTVEHLDVISALILDICGGQAGPIDDQITRLPERRPVRLRAARCDKVLGISVAPDRIGEIFNRLGLMHTRSGQGADTVFEVTPPPRRFDLEIEEDLIEEVARIHGYDHIPARAPLARALPLPAPEAHRSGHDLRQAAVGRGYTETINFAFVDPQWEADFAGQREPIRLLNPIVAPMSAMRSTLIGSLVQVLASNLAHRARRVRVFELGRVFRRNPSATAGELAVAGIEQPLRLAGLAWGSALPPQWGEAERRVDFFDVKGDVVALCAGAGRLDFRAETHPALHPGRSASIWLDGWAIGWLGELHPRWVQRYELHQPPVVFELDAQALQTRAMPSVQPINRVPAVQRDLAFAVPAGVDFAQIDAAMRGAIESDPRCGIIREVRLFDLFTPENGGGLRSMAFRLQLQDNQTLTDDRVDRACAALVEAVSQSTGAHLRQ